MDAQTLTKARTKMNLTQSALAKKLGLSVRQISRYETGESPIEPWLQRALQSLQLRAAEMLPPALVRKIRNAVTLTELQEIKAILGLTEPEAPFTYDELQAKVDLLFDPDKGLYFDEDNEDAWERAWGDEDGDNGNRTVEEAAKNYANEWLERYMGLRGRRIEKFYLFRDDVSSFFVSLIMRSQNENPSQENPDLDSRNTHIETIESWLHEKFRPFQIPFSTS